METSNKILSDITVFMKYAKYLPDVQRRETWSEIVNRNEQLHIKKFPKLAKEIRTAYKLVHDRKVLPSMRSIQFAGKPITLNPARIYNCSFLPMDHQACFSELMFLLLSGVGVGYSVQRDHVEQLPEIRKPTRTRRYLVGDSIEGWADAVKVLLSAYYEGKAVPIFDFSDIRPKGALLVTSGGKAPGPEPLADCLHDIKKVLDRKNDGSKLSPLEVHDINCYIADAVLAGGIRRSAMIALFDLDEDEMLTCKFGEWYKLEPQRGRANNSAVIMRHKITEDVFLDLWKKIELSNAGEPGFFMSNDQNMGLNPCAEISLKAYQFCNLVTINASDLKNQEDLNKRARAAAFIATLQASYTNFHYLRDVWQKTTEKEALIGVSMTGIASGDVMGLDMKEAANIVKDENARVAEMIGINKAARCTTVKPEGCQTTDTLVSKIDGIWELGELGNISEDKWQTINFGTTNGILSDMGVVSTSLYGRYNTIGRFFNNGFADTKKITFNSGLSVEATPNHQYKVLREGIYQWCRSDKLVIGDIVPYTIGQHTGGTFQTLTFNPIISKYAHNINNIPTQQILDDEFAWVLGLYYADGSNHAKGIRISGNWNEQKGFERITNFFTKRFGIVPTIVKHNSTESDLRCQLVINSALLLQLLEQNGLKKGRSYEIDVPLAIRKSPPEIIRSFFDGFIVGDGNSFKKETPSFVTTSEKFARQSVVILRLIGQDAKFRVITSRSGGFGNRQQYWISIRKGRTSDKRYISTIKKDIWNILDSLDFHHMSYDIITEIENSKNYTVDIEVPSNETYVANSYISHNTTSLVLGSSSGIHAWHDKYYIRRMRVGKNESIYGFLRDNHPELIKDEFFKPNIQAVIEVPQKAPEGAITRDETAIDLLNRVSKVWKQWVKPGHRKGSNVNNVSTTVSIRRDEWDKVGEWLWEHRTEYTAISCLPADDNDHVYVQAPFESITEKQYNEMVKHLHDIDLSKITEIRDDTTLQEQLACAGATGCEIT